MKPILSNYHIKVGKFALGIALLLMIPAVVWSMTDNGDGTRTFFVGVGKDFLTTADIVWGVPAGVMTGDIVSGITVRYQTSSGGYAGCTTGLPVNIIFDRCIRGE